MKKKKNNLLKRNKTIIIAAIIVVFGVFFIFYGPQGYKNSNVCFSRTCITAEVARTEEQKAKGLMGRDTLAENAGMLFVYDSDGIYPFWMKDTTIPLDIIWVNSDKKVVHIEEADPCIGSRCLTLNPNSLEARYVIEVNQGYAKKNNIKVGDSVDINI